MSTRKISFAFGEYYHVYNRGTDKREIFLDEEDRLRFLKLLFVANGTKGFIFRDFPIGLPYVAFDRGETLVSVGAYCLMPNHFHILIREKTEGGISKFMNKVQTSYTMYFNKKYQRSGRLFQGAFKAKHVDTDEYLRYLFAYIHLNPIKILEPNWKTSGIADVSSAGIYLYKYIFSSYVDYLGQERDEAKILTRQDFPEYFQKPKEFSYFIREFLLLKDSYIG